MTETSRAGFWLSPQQRRLFLLGDDRQGLHVQGWLRLSGPLDVRRVEEALGAIGRRHDALRTQFLEAVGRKVPMQVVSDGLVLELRQHPETVDEGPEAPGKMAALLAAEARRPFDEMPLQALWVRRREGEHDLLLTLPPTCADRRSLDTLAAELARALSADDPSTALDGDEDEVFGYLQFAEWQNDMVDDEDDEDRQAARTFWDSRSAPNGLPALALESTPSIAGERRAVHRPLAPDTAAAVFALAAGYGVEPSSVPLAAWALLLSRLTNRTHVDVGWVGEGREFEMLEDCVGPLARWLPVGAEVVPGTPFEQWVRHFDAEVEAVEEHQDHVDLYFARVSDDASDPATPGFGFEWLPEPQVHRAGDSTLRWVRRSGELAPTRLTLAVCLGGERPELSLRGPDAAYRQGDLDRLAELWEGFLVEACAAPETSVDALMAAVANPGEASAAGPPAAGPSSPPPLIPTGFIARAAERPGDVALVCGAQTLTYGELDAQTERVAAALRRRGVGAEVRVGLVAERTAEAVVSMLGISRAGGTFVPLDPTLPQGRLDTMADAASIRWVVHHGAPLPLDAAVEQVALADLLDEGLDRVEVSGAPAVATVEGDHAAYVLFTSGSTGRPKGVVVEHRQLAAYVDAIARHLEPQAGEGYALVSTLAADLGHTVLFTSLVHGGRLLLVDGERVALGASLAEDFERHGVDVLKIVPSHLAAVLEGPRAASVVPRRAVVLGGEALGWPLAERLHGLAPQCQVFNHYGPTETTVGVACGAVSSELLGDGPRSATVPLGCALDRTRLRVADTALRPLPLWLAGELVVGGAQVSRGYVGDPVATAQRFVPDPWSTEPGMRLYRTGDRVRQLPGGRFEFVGRIDDQLKIRGFRVEPGEVTALLLERPEVREAVVLARSTGEGATADQRLVAWVGADRTAHAALEQGWRSDLRARLPAHMVPSALVVLEHLPLTANGKIDRRALPEPTVTVGDAIAPRTPVEEILADLFADLLERSSVGVEDSFFDLGGHSLLATQLASRVASVFDVDLPLALFFEGPTVARLASEVERASGEGRTVAPPIEPRPAGEEAVLSFAQERLWFVDQMEGSGRLFASVHGLRLRGTLEVEALRSTLEALVERHEILRTTFPSDQGRPRVVVHPPGPVDLETCDLGDLSPEDALQEVTRRAHVERQRPFDLAKGPLLRALLLRLADDHHCLVLSLHHITSDAWSVAVMAREVAAIYGALVRGATPALDPLPLQYSDVAAWQRRWLRGPVLEELVDHWRHTLAEAPLLELPMDHPDAVSQSRGAAIRVGMDTGLGDGLEALGRRHGATLFMTLLAAFDVLLASLSGGKDISVGTAVANRGRMETEGLIGPFINMLVLRTDLSGNPRFQEVLERVRATTLGAFAHQDLPFEKLVDELRPAERGGGTPFFRVAFGLQNAPEPQLALPGLTLAGLEMETDVARYDLTVWVYRREGEFSVRWTYDRDRWEVTTVQAWQRQYERLLRAVVEDPEIRTDALEGMAQATRPSAADAAQRDAEQARDLMKFRRRGRTKVAVTVESTSVDTTTKS